MRNDKNALVNRTKIFVGHVSGTRATDKIMTI
jgi:hypothetical protein